MLLPVSGDRPLRAASRRWRAPVIWIVCDGGAAGCDAAAAGGAAASDGVSAGAGSAASELNGQAMTTESARWRLQGKNMEDFLSSKRGSATLLDPAGRAARSTARGAL